jgi:hypothetical protein
MDRKIPFGLKFYSILFLVLGLMILLSQLRTGNGWRFTLDPFITTVLVLCYSISELFFFFLAGAIFKRKVRRFILFLLVILCLGQALRVYFSLVELSWVLKGHAILHTILERLKLIGSVLWNIFLLFIFVKSIFYFKTKKIKEYFNRVTS